MVTHRLRSIMDLIKSMSLSTNRRIRYSPVLLKNNGAYAGCFTDKDGDESDSAAEAVRINYPFGYFQVTFG